MNSYNYLCLYKNYIVNMRRFARSRSYSFLLDYQRESRRRSPLLKADIKLHFKYDENYYTVNIYSSEDEVDRHYWIADIFINGDNVANGSVIDSDHGFVIDDIFYNDEFIDKYEDGYTEISKCTYSIGHDYLYLIIDDRAYVQEVFSNEFHILAKSPYSDYWMHATFTFLNTLENLKIYCQDGPHLYDLRMDVEKNRLYNPEIKISTKIPQYHSDISVIAKPTKI